MAISTNDLLKIPYFDSVTVVAGRKGLGRAITSAGILDYEYSPDYTMKQQVFLRDSLLVSSLLFAKENPDALLNAMRELISLGVAGLAFKNVFFTDLPAEALALADEHDFPILRFGMELYIEEFIFHVMENIQLERQMQEKETLLSDLLEDRISKNELHRVVKLIDPYLDRYVYAAYVSLKSKPDFHFFESVYRGPTGLKHIDDTTTVCRYRNGIFILISDHHDEEKRYAARFEDIMAYLSLEPGSCWVGRGQMNHCPEELDISLQQAYFASLCAQITEKDSQDYNAMGLYQVLIPHAKNPHMLRFMAQYLDPVLTGGNESSQEFFQTAVAYVLSEGDVSKTAERVFCHKNTVRYRLNKLHERLNPDASELVFFEQLSTAVRIYLLNQM